MTQNNSQVVFLSKKLENTGCTTLKDFNVSFLEYDYKGHGTHSLFNDIVLANTLKHD